MSLTAGSLISYVATGVYYQEKIASLNQKIEGLEYKIAFILEHGYHPFWDGVGHQRQEVT